jgi:myo-inositol-1(or 4)-monophosphatase
MTQRLQTAITAARNAGRILRQKLESPREIRAKGRRDIVTDADYAAERAVRSICRARHPADRFLSEEDSQVQRDELWKRVEENEDERLWVVDPLDGTTNYARRIPSFCVSVALYHKRAVQVGVVYDPVRDELFAAERNGGAVLNGRRMAVSPTRLFAHAVIGTEWARGQVPRERTAAIFARMVGRATTARAFGSAALSLCYVGAARLDGYFHLSLSPWDVAAAALIVEEAGGRVSTLGGKAWDLHSQGYIASNGHLHRQLLKYFGKD